MDNLDSQVGSNLRREIIMTRLICLTFQKQITGFKDDFKNTQVIVKLRTFRILHEDFPFFIITIKAQSCGK